jgi:hypothetical protein
MPCGTTVTTINANLLLAQKVTFAAPLTVTALGQIANQPSDGLKGFLTLYDDLSGSPGSLKTYTNTTTIVAGDNRIPVLSSVTLPAGTYWIAAEYASGASICADNSTTNEIAYVQVTYPAVPNPFGTSTKTSSVDFNFYVAGTP